MPKYDENLDFYVKFRMGDTPRPKKIMHFIIYHKKGENTLKGQIGPMLPQNINNILKRTNTPQYNVEVLWLMLAKRNPVSDWSKRFYNDPNL